MIRSRQEDTWQALFSSKQSIITAAITTVIFIFSIYSYTNFLEGVEGRRGFSFTDPILELITPVDLSWFIFILLYGSLIIALASVIRTPAFFFHILRAYTILVAIRIICMWLLPLEAPAGTIVLVDPMAELVGAGATVPLTKDLFFSGHVSVLCLMSLMFQDRALKIFFGFMAIAIAGAVLLQHVHYTVDVVVAPLAAITAFKLSKNR